MPRVRVDVSSLGAGWNPTLEWYAKAVAKLQTLPATDRTSWRYLGGIHGYKRETWISKGVITDKDPLPPDTEWDGRMWNQCQHQGYFFLPWHRGYLHAFEEIVGATVKALGGPSDWALPYWNYFDGDSALQMHAAFTDPKMPDKTTDNPLAAPPRTNTALDKTKISLDAMKNKIYTSASGTSGFGGGVTIFKHFGGLTGALELNPHNSVHRRIGGFMEDPNTAGLDPIFWLHHCNVDRLWAAWLTRKDHVMEDGDAWKNGPVRKFEMPGPDGQLHAFTPAETMPGGRLAPTYDDLQNGTGLPAVSSSLEEVEAEAMPARLSSEPPPPATLVGANSGRITIGETAATTDVRLQPQATELAGLAAEQRVFLNLENIRGRASSATLTVRISAPAAASALTEGPSFSQSIDLFGLAESSGADGEHGGNGISVAIDITEIANQLAPDSGTPVEQLEVRIEQEDAEAPVTVERVSIYKQPVG